MMVFINKLDREGKDAFDLLDEVEKKLRIKVTPLSWPIGMGQRFQGVYNLFEKKLNLFKPHHKQGEDETLVIEDLNTPELGRVVGEPAAKTLREELETVTTVYPEFDVKDYLASKISPVFFGSAVNNFGVKELLDCFVRISPDPMPRETEERIILPQEKKFSGFVFKIHANIDPRHRDRIAFVRVVSGKFERNKLYHLVRQNKDLKFSNPYSFLAAKKRSR